MSYTTYTSWPSDCFTTTKWLANFNFNLYLFSFLDFFLPSNLVTSFNPNVFIHHTIQFNELYFCIVLYIKPVKLQSLIGCINHWKNCRSSINSCVFSQEEVDNVDNKWLTMFILIHARSMYFKLSINICFNNIRETRNLNSLIGHLIPQIC